MNCMFAESWNSFKMGKEVFGERGGFGFLRLLVKSCWDAVLSFLQISLTYYWDTLFQLVLFGYVITQQNHTDPIFLLGVNGIGVGWSKLLLHHHYSEVLAAVFDSPVTIQIPDAEDFSRNHISSYSM